MALQTIVAFTSYQECQQDFLMLTKDLKIYDRDFQISVDIEGFPQQLLQTPRYLLRLRENLNNSAKSDKNT